MKGDGRRPRRVAEILRAKLAELLMHRLEDPILSTLVITTVEMPPDLSVARIGVRVMGADDDAKQRALALRALNRAASRMRRLVAPSLGLRRAPELHFKYDAGPEAARRVEELLAEIADEPHSDHES